MKQERTASLLTAMSCYWSRAPSGQVPLYIRPHLPCFQRVVPVINSPLLSTESKSISTPKLSGPPVWSSCIMNSLLSSSWSAPGLSPSIYSVLHLLESPLSSSLPISCPSLTSESSSGSFSGSSSSVGFPSLGVLLRVLPGIFLLREFPLTRVFLRVHLLYWSCLSRVISFFPRVSLLICKFISKGGASSSLAVGIRSRSYGPSSLK